MSSMSRNWRRRSRQQQIQRCLPQQRLPEISLVFIVRCERRWFGNHEEHAIISATSSGLFRNPYSSFKNVCLADCHCNRSGGSIGRGSQTGPRVMVAPSLSAPPSPRPCHAILTWLFLFRREFHVQELRRRSRQQQMERCLPQHRFIRNEFAFYCVL
ncbi:hypothetical protein CEXT_69051 [Caerostris extrusa]|uniref:Uncharacterized protein n=1 Tax=Caerostris extrusa TaxID=172846 RepID=A0AAV4T9J2_CAEEX|nr:hypothetical protein CEXT_69051 [Caerostris extrusa]